MSDSRRSASDLQPAPGGYPIKLVRDRTPEVLNGSGRPGDLFYGPLPASGESRMTWLRRKLGEEVTEYLVGGEYEELLDVLAVIEALTIEHGGSLGGSLALVRDHPRGGFRDAVMMYGHHQEFDG